MIHLLLLWALFPLLWDESRHWWRGSADHREASEAVLATGPSTEAQVYRLAARQSGKVSVSDLVIELSCSVHEAEELLHNMTDNIRVRMDVQGNGVVTYNFVELSRKHSGGV